MKGAVDVDGRISICGLCVECSNTTELIINIDDIGNNNNAI